MAFITPHADVHHIKKEISAWSLGLAILPPRPKEESQAQDYLIDVRAQWHLPPAALGR